MKELDLHEMRAASEKRLLEIDQSLALFIARVEEFQDKKKRTAESIVAIDRLLEFKDVIF